MCSSDNQFENRSKCFQFYACGGKRYFNLELFGFFFKELNQALIKLPNALVACWNKAYLVNWKCAEQSWNSVKILKLILGKQYQSLFFILDYHAFCLFGVCIFKLLIAQFRTVYKLFLFSFLCRDELIVWQIQELRVSVTLIWPTEILEEMLVKNVRMNHEALRFTGFGGPHYDLFSTF